MLGPTAFMAAFDGSKFKQGDLVVHRSGGPRLVVLDVFLSAGGVRAYTVRVGDQDGWPSGSALLCEFELAAAPPGELAQLIVDLTAGAKDWQAAGTVAAVPDQAKPRAAAATALDAAKESLVEAGDFEAAARCRELAESVRKGGPVPKVEVATDPGGPRA